MRPSRPYHALFLHQLIVLSVSPFFHLDARTASAFCLRLRLALLPDHEVSRGGLDVLQGVGPTVRVDGVDGPIALNTMSHRFDRYRIRLWPLTVMRVGRHPIVCLERSCGTLPISSACCQGPCRPRAVSSAHGQSRAPSIPEGIPEPPEALRVVVRVAAPAPRVADAPDEDEETDVAAGREGAVEVRRV